MQVFNVDALGYKSIAFVLGFVALTVAIVLVTSWTTQGRGQFMGWFVFGVVVLVSLGLLVQLSAVRIVIDGPRLTAGGGMYTTTVDRRAIQMDGIRPFSGPGGSPDLGYRTNGVGMPGLSLGWFQPVKGKKLFALVTAQGTPILLPTSLGYDLVVSPVDAERFLAAVKSM